MSVSCPYCQSETVLMTGEELYGDAQLAHKNFWVCSPCAAWVGCHPHTRDPLGTPAKEPLRQLRTLAHSVFDILWEEDVSRNGKSRVFSRRAHYQWLAGCMGISIEGCHIGLFNEDQCKQAIEICTPWAKPIFDRYVRGQH